MPIPPTDMAVTQTPAPGGLAYLRISKTRALPSQAVREAGIASVAVVLKHAYIFGEHEEAVGALARELGFTQVTRHRHPWLRQSISCIQTQPCLAASVRVRRKALC